MPIIVASLHLIAIFVLWMWRNPEGDDGFGNWAFLATLALYQTQLVLLTSWMMLRRYSFDSPALEPREPWIDNAAGLGGPLYGLTAGVMLALEESQHIEGFLIAFITFTIVVAAAPLLIVSLPLMIARQFGWRWTNSPLRGPPIRFSLGQFFMATVIVAVG
ncbi:MAG TPA: hypothetical protein VGE52_02750, partial [Pirellulales bacterium]